MTSYSKWLDILQQDCDRKIVNVTRGKLSYKTILNLFQYKPLNRVVNYIIQFQINSTEFNISTIQLLRESPFSVIVDSQQFSLIPPLPSRPPRYIPPIATFRCFVFRLLFVFSFSLDGMAVSFNCPRMGMAIEDELCYLFEG